MKTLTLQDLFLKPQPVTIKKGDGELTLFVRRLNQVEKELCQAGARTASRGLRKILENPKSADRKLLIEDEMADYSTEQLKALWINAKIVDKTIAITRQTLEDRDQTYVPEPEGDGVTPADIDRYENEIEHVEEQREESVTKAVESARKALEQQVKKVTAKKLRDEAAPLLIDTICTQAWHREYTAGMIARGTFLDKEGRKPAFKTVDEIRTLDPEILEQLANAHYGLLVEPEALKPLGGEVK